MIKTKKSEDGVALLLSLGFAALLLVLIMGFATNSLIERKVAGTTADRTQAKLMAQSVLNRAIAAMRYRMLLQGYTNYDAGLYRFDPVVSSGPDDYTEDDDIFTAVSIDGSSRQVINIGKDILYEYPTLSTKDPNTGASLSSAEHTLRTPKWQILKNDDDSQVLGRFMYAVLPDIGKVYKSQISKDAKTRDGIFVDELRIEEMSNAASPSPKDLWDRDTLADAIASSNYHIEQAFVKKINPDETFREILEKTHSTNTFFARNLIETIDVELNNLDKKFYIPTPTSTPPPTTPNYQNFVNLNTLDWNSYNNSISDPNDIKNDLPFLKKIGDSLSIRNQIIANLIDYNDTNHTPTSDVPATDWSIASGNVPTYTGNEKTPYLNEFVVKIDAKSTTTATLIPGVDPNPDKVEYKIKLDELNMTLDVELINFFKEEDAPLAATCIVKPYIIMVVDAEYKIRGTVNKFWDNREIKVSSTAFDTLIVPAPGSSMYSQGSLTADLFKAYPELPASISVSSSDIVLVGAAPDLKVTITVKELRIGEAILEYDTFGNVDYVAETVNLPPVNISLVKDTSMTPDSSDIQQEDTGCGFYAIDDARANLKGWIADASVTNATLGSRNSISKWNVSTGDFPLITDGELDTNPRKTILYDITNEPMESAAELGMIHRGQPWQTLNISKAGGAGNNIDNITGNTTYTDGDGGILDQVTVESASQKLVDINTRSPNIWRALFADIEQDSAAIFTTDLQINTLAQHMATLIRNENLFFRSRSGILRPMKTLNEDIKITPVTSETLSPLDSAIDATAVALTKRKKDALVGKTLPLTKTEPYPETIQVIVVVQTIKDRDGAGELGKYDTGDDGDPILAEVKLLAKVKRVGEKFEIVHIEYLID